MKHRFDKFLTVLLVIIVVIVLALLGYLAYDYLSKYFGKKDAEEAVDTFEQQVVQNVVEQTNTQVEDNATKEEPLQQNEQQTSSGNSSGKTYTYKGYNMIGTIQIPKTKIKCPIVDKVTPSSIVSAVAVLYGAGLNQVGNTVIVGHNYRDGTFFSNNKKLVAGDKIYITDATGTKVEYTIYNTYITTDQDLSYAVRDTAGKREISLSTCTENPTQRLVIWARAE